MRRSGQLSDPEAHRGGGMVWGNEAGFVGFYGGAGFGAITGAIVAAVR